MLKLYNVTTIDEEFDGCRNVTFHWFRSEPPESNRRPYEDLIADYNPSRWMRFCYAEEAIEELFSEDEAKQLVAYLNRKWPEDAHSIGEVELPIANMAGWGCEAVGGKDFYLLDTTPGYPLPFKVRGYFNLVGCELVDGSGVYHEWLYLLSPNGEMRKQTNEEAAAMEHSLVGAEGAAAA